MSHFEVDYVQSEKLDFTVPSSMRSLMAEKLNEPSVSRHREKKVRISNIPTLNEKYIWHGEVSSIYTPRALTSKKLEKEGNVLVVAQLKLNALTGAVSEMDYLVDQDPCGKPNDYIMAQYLFITKKSEVVRGKKGIKEVVLYQGVGADNQVRIVLGDEIDIYGPSHLGIRYSSNGFPYRRGGAEGHLWYVLRGTIVQDIDEAISEMSTVDNGVSKLVAIWQ